MAGKRPTFKDFIERSEINHGDRYDYSKSIYNGMRNDINIICKIHGEFWQNAFWHCSKGINANNIILVLMDLKMILFMNF